ncbi:MAG: hypothetical protein Q7S37_01295 [bacterium]|nr:hypothetical protein [bacterium]
MEGTQGTNSIQSPETINQPLPPTGASSLNSQSGSFPDELNHWNWGAFLLNAIWAIGMNNGIGVVLGLFTGIIGAIVLGIKGNEWAWKSRKFESVEQFKLVQRAWAKAGIIFLVVCFLIFSISLTAFILATRSFYHTIKGGAQTVQKYINEGQVRPVHPAALSATDNALYQKVNMRRIFPDNPPLHYSIEYRDDPSINRFWKKSVLLTQDNNPPQINEPHFTLLISPWEGVDSEFLLPRGIPKTSLQSLNLENGTMANSYWENGGELRSVNNGYNYSYNIFWIKKPLIFQVIAGRYIGATDVINPILDKDIIQKSALEMANKLSTNSAYLFQ